MKHLQRLIWFGICSTTLVGIGLGKQESTTTQTAEFSPEDIEFFESKIRPLLVEHCFECHSQQAEFAEGGLLLDSREGLLKGGDSGPAIDLQSPDKSLFLSAIQYGDLFQMPPSSKLPPERIDLFSSWLKRGAPWPAGESAGTTRVEEFDLAKRRSEHWCWQAPRPVAPPAITDPVWSGHAIDAFVRERLNQRGLTPNSPASREVLIRRAYFDLIGLPPTPQQVQAFVNDPSDAAFEKVIDQLLASPHFGERWARHWMDLVRYAETCGHEFDFPIKNAYRYRDYLIRAFNADVPYDQFVIEHVAGDLLEQPRLHPVDSINESVLATGFWFLGEAVHAPVDVKGDEANRVDNQIDILTKTFLGLTVACARCHDHKFDAISDEDYYALSGFLQSSHRQEVMLDPHGLIAGKVEQLSERVHESDQLAQQVQESFRKTDPLTLAKHLAAAVEALAAVSEDQNTPGQTPGKEADIESVSLNADEQAPARAAKASARASAIERIARQHGMEAKILQRWVAALAAEESFSQPMFAFRQLALELSRDPNREFETARQRVLETFRTQADEARKTRSAAVRFADFSPDNFEQWNETGFAWGGRSTQLGSAETAATGPLAEHDVAHSGRLGKRLFGVLRSPTFTIEHSHVHYRMLAERIQVRLIIDGFEMDVHNALLFADMTFSHDSQGEFGWRTQSGDLSRYLGHRAHIEIIDHGDGFAAIDEIWFSNGPVPAEIPCALVEPALESAASIQEFCHRFASSILGQADSDSSDPIRAANWSVRHGLGLIADQKSLDRLDQLSEQIKTLQADTPEPQLALGITDGSGENEFLFIRGNHRNLGPQLERDLISALPNDSGLTLDRSKGSGRMYLARRIVDPANPLTARVMVNRVWHHLFGRGLVGSVDNFGVLGELPTHPEMLDYLAIEFVNSGWSTKNLIKRIMTSQTYQMSSSINPSNETADPDNQHYHRFPVKRLQGEAIRDAMLLISGDLDPTLFGPSVPVHLTPFMEGRGRPGASGPLNGNGRRSIYTEVRRNFLPPMMLAFDTPIPFNTMGRRSESNVPAQALILMNSPFVIDQAGKWAARLIEEQADPRLRIETIYQQAFSRQPSAAEIDQAMAFLRAQAAEIKLDPSQLGSHRDLWTDYCHVILNVKEFIYLR